MCVCVHIYIYIYIYINLNTLARRKYIASNLRDFQVKVCFCALRIPPVDLAKVHYLDRFSIQVLHLKSTSIRSTGALRNAQKHISM